MILVLLQVTAITFIGKPEKKLKIISENGVDTDRYPHNSTEVTEVKTKHRELFMTL